MATGCLCVCLYVCLSICLSVYLSVSACILFFACLDLFMFICLSFSEFYVGFVFVFVCACMWVCLRVCRASPPAPPRVHSLLVTESVIATNTIKTPCLSIS